MTADRSIYFGPWRIDVSTRPAAASLPPGLTITALARSVAAALSAAGAEAPASIGLTLSDDAELALLNEQHLGEPGPTDVLSFPLLPPEAYPGHPRGAASGLDGRDASPDPSTRVPGAPSSLVPVAFALPPGRRRHLGDIVVSVERAAAQADEGRGGQTGDVAWSVADELRLLVVHGTLHVCGWDHAEPIEETAMRDLEQSLLSGG